MQHSAKLSWYSYLWGEVNSKLQVSADIQTCEETTPWVIMSMWTSFTQKNTEPFNSSYNTFNYKHPYLNLDLPSFPNCLPSSHLGISILCLLVSWPLISFYRFRNPDLEILVISLKIMWSRPMTELGFWAQSVCILSFSFLSPSQYLFPPPFWVRHFPWTLSPPVSTSRVLGLKVFITMPS